ncbi:MAG TPA: right-handed parallel beta-helix repeat-containing protein, partial [Thermoanaerobaculia bacterium]|nr:right-handed parallel beta-helix repeat-containing protein [Thermoanaerobaculia bacterium]
MKLLVPLALALCLVTTAIADTNVSGTINTDTTWTAAASPYLVTGTVTVASPRTLTIEPGVTVKFNTNTGLTINGRLLALGTSAANITFTAAAATPTRGSWQPILLNGGTNPASELTYATISYGGSGSSTGIVRIASGAATLDHVTITESATAGIYSLTAGAVTLTSITVANCTGDGLLAETWSGNLTGLHTITDATFATNGGHGVNLGRAGRASITGTTFTDNTNYAVGAEPGTRLDALTAITASGNGGGAKNAVGYRTGTMNARDETWQASSVLAYVIVGGNVVVGSGRTLTIEPGTTIKFSANTGMTVQGTLLAVGTSTNPITFTAAATAPVRGSWRNIDVNAGTNPASRLEHVTVSYGGSGYLFRVWNGTVVIEHSTFTECAGIGVSSHGTGAVTLTASTISNCNSHGLYIEDVYGNPGPHVITDSTITGNGGYGIYVAQRGRASVTNTAISGNTLGGLTSDTSAIDARYCYWGAPTGPGGSGFGTGNSVNTNVLFEPWFAAAPAGAHRFSTYSITNRTFNPTISTTSNPSFGATAAGDWTVTVLNASSTAVRTFTGTGTTGLVSWDGKDTAGTTQPSANYTYEFASSATLVPMRARTILDTTRQLTLTGFAGTPAYLSPNADGIQDTSLLAGTTTFDDLTWSLAVKNSGGSTVRSVAGTGLVTFTWDGRND